MKRAIKFAVIWLYCHNAMSAAVTAYVFNKINLKDE